MKIALLAALALVAFSSATAAPTWHTSKIKAVYPQANGDVVIVFTENAPTCLNTSASKYHYVRVGQNSMTEDGLKLIMSAALAVASAGKSVAVSFDSTTTGCFINRLWASFD